MSGYHAYDPDAYGGSEQAAAYDDNSASSLLDYYSEAQQADEQFQQQFEALALQPPRLPEPSGQDQWEQQWGRQEQNAEPWMSFPKPDHQPEQTTQPERAQGWWEYNLRLQYSQQLQLPEMSLQEQGIPAQDCGSGDPPVQCKECLEWIPRWRLHLLYGNKPSRVCLDYPGEGRKLCKNCGDVGDSGEFQKPPLPESTLRNNPTRSARSRAVSDYVKCKTCRDKQNHRRHQKNAP